MKTINEYLYNWALFTEASREASVNVIFWSKINDLKRKHPKDKIVIKYDVQYYPEVSRWAEVLVISCDNNLIAKTAAHIYQTYYQAVPLVPVRDNPEITEQEVRS